jgi:periplasmic protein CpxP/Spy
MDILQKSKFLTFVVIGLLIINFGTLAFLFFKKPPLPPIGPPPNEVRGFLEQELNMNDNQKKELDKLKEEHHSRIISLQDTIKLIKDKMFDQLSLMNVDSSLVKQFASTIGEKQTAIELITFEHFRKVRNVCDDNQKQKFDKIMKDVVRMIEGKKFPPPPPGMPPHPPR